MPTISILGDQCTGHGSWPPRSNNSASPNVTAGGVAVHRQGDGWATHCNPVPVCHASVLASGSGTVTINNKQCGRIGDPVACGSSVAGPGVPSVTVGG